MNVGFGVVINLVAVRAVLMLLVAQATGIAKVKDLTLDKTVAPEGRVRGVAIGTLVVLKSSPGGSAHLFGVRGGGRCCGT